MSVATVFFSPASSLAHPPRRPEGAAAKGELRGTHYRGVTWRLPPRIYSPRLPRRRPRRSMAVRMTALGEARPT